ncbi:13731_t:CDS:2, partial [Racocetra persica]
VNMDPEKSDDEEETAGEKEISYMDSQLNDYIDKLNSKVEFDKVAKPNKFNGEIWTKYLKTIKSYSDKMKRKNEKTQRKCIKEIIEKSISTKSVTQNKQYKQVYDHIVDLIKLFDDHEILIKVWIIEL